MRGGGARRGAEGVASLIFETNPLDVDDRPFNSAITAERGKSWYWAPALAGGTTNCSTAAARALEAGGVSLTDFAGATPDTLLDALALQNIGSGKPAQKSDGSAPSSQRNSGSRDNRQIDWSIDGSQITGNRMNGSRICPNGENSC